MRSVDIGARLAVVPLVCLGAVAAGQDDVREGARDAAGRDLSTCRSSSASRTRDAACGETEQAVLRAETEITTRFEVSPRSTPRCAVEIALEYLQWDTTARVEGTIENSQCAASRGEYTIDIRVRDEHGDLKALEFDESWARDDDESVTFESEYGIGDGVELVRVRASGATCTCSDTSEE